MRIKKRSSKTVHEGDMTPMIDMTFQLIAFFMVLINFSEAEQDRRVVLPESELAKPPEKSPEDKLTVQITNRKSERVVIDGRTYPLGDEVSTVLSRKAAYFESQGSVVADVIVIIRAHHLAPTGDVQDVIRRCQEAGFEKFVLRAKEKL